MEFLALNLHSTSPHRTQGILRTVVHPLLINIIIFKLNRLHMQQEHRPQDHRRTQAKITLSSVDQQLLSDLIYKSWLKNNNDERSVTYSFKKRVKHI